jgi:hypothetical protein
MTKVDKLKNWIEKIPDNERDMPYFKIDGKLISPNKRLALEALKEKRRVLSTLESVSINELTEVDKDEIVKTRTEIMVKNAKKQGYPMLRYSIMGSDPVPISEMVKELQENSEIGQEWKKVQLTAMNMQLAKLEE